MLHPAAPRLAGADVAVAISGYTGPVGAHANGLVGIAAANRNGRDRRKAFQFGEASRDAGRALAVVRSLALLREALIDFRHAGLPARGGTDKSR